MAILCILWEAQVQMHALNVIIMISATKLIRDYVKIQIVVFLGMQSVYNY